MQSGGWEPYSPVVRAENGPTFASTFPSEAQQQPEEVFIAVVGFGSKSNASASAAWLMLDPSYVKRGSSAYRLFDLYRGVELPLPQDRNLSFSMDASMESGRVGASGFGALLLTQKALDPALQAFLQKMRALTSKGPIGSFSCGGGPQCAGAVKSWPFYAECNMSVCAGLLQTMVPIAPTPQHAQAPTRGMVSGTGGPVVPTGGGAWPDAPSSSWGAGPAPGPVPDKGNGGLARGVALSRTTDGAAGGGAGPGGVCLLVGVNSVGVSSLEAPLEWHPLPVVGTSRRPMSEPSKC